MKKNNKKFPKLLNPSPFEVNCYLQDMHNYFKEENVDKKEWEYVDKIYAVLKEAYLQYWRKNV